MRLTGILCVALCGLAAPAAADVTVTQTVAGKAAVIDLNGESVTRIKGNKMRTEQTRGDKTDVVIIDIDGQRMISLDAGKKEATVIPLSQLQETLGKVTSSEVKVKITPTGETKQVAGYSCTGARHGDCDALQSGRRRHEDGHGLHRPELPEQGRAGHGRLCAALHGRGREGLHLRGSASGQGTDGRAGQGPGRRSTRRWPSRACRSSSTSRSASRAKGRWRG